MRFAVRKLVAEGALWGIFAGLIFAIVEVLATAALGEHPAVPLRMCASLIFGRAALELAAPTAMSFGLVAHFVLSAGFGSLYGALLGSLPRRVRATTGAQAVLGIAFGVGIYLLAFQVFARAAAPWLLGTSQIVQPVVHALAFGLPLALGVASSERRTLGMQFHRRTV